MRRRVVDVAGTINSFGKGAHVAVTYNGQSLGVDSFEDYMRLFPTPSSSDMEGTSSDAKRTKSPSSSSSASSSSSSDDDDTASDGPEPGAPDHPETFEPVHVRLNQHCEIGVSVADEASCVSFVNGIATAHGGTHVDEVLTTLSKSLAELIGKRHTGKEHS